MIRIYISLVFLSIIISQNGISGSGRDSKSGLGSNGSRLKYDSEDREVSGTSEANDQFEAYHDNVTLNVDSEPDTRADCSESPSGGPSNGKGKGGEYEWKYCSKKNHIRTMVVLVIIIISALIYFFVISPKLKQKN